LSLLAEPGHSCAHTHVNVHAHVIAIPSGVDMADGFTTGYSSANNLREGLAPQPPPQVVIQQQDQVIRQQDQALDQLSASVGMLHRMGNEIHGELITQSALIDDLDRGVDQTKDALISQQGRLKKLIKKSRDNWLFFVIILLIVILGVILWFVFNS